MLKADQVSIREFSKLIGTMVAAEPGVLYAALYYKTLELDRDRELKLNARNFDASMNISTSPNNVFNGGSVILIKHTDLYLLVPWIAGLKLIAPGLDMRDMT